MGHSGLLELWVAIALATSACSSSVVFYFTREQEGKIHLPTHVDESEDAVHGNDPFEVTTPEDIIDGYPIYEDAFWTSVRLVTWSSCDTARSYRFVNRCDSEKFSPPCYSQSY